MIKDPKRYREQSEREWMGFLRGLTYAESIRMVEDLLSDETEDVRIWDTLQRLLKEVDAST